MIRDKNSVGVTFCQFKNKRNKKKQRHEAFRDTSCHAPVISDYFPTMPTATVGKL